MHFQTFWCVCVCWEKAKVFRGKRKNNIGGSRLCSRRRVSSSPSSCWGVGVLGPSFLTPLTLIDRSRGGEQVRVPSIRGPLFPYSSGSRRLLSLSYTFLWHFVDVCFSAFLSFVLVGCFISYSSESLFFRVLFLRLFPPLSVVLPHLIRQLFGWLAPPARHTLHPSIALSDNRSPPPLVQLGRIHMLLSLICLMCVCFSPLHLQFIFSRESRS